MSGDCAAPADVGDAAEPTRQVWHFGLLIPVLFAVITSHWLAARPLMIAPFNNVAFAGPAPRGLVSAYGEDEWSVVIHRSDWSPPVAAALGHTGPGRPPRLGWVVREWSVLTLPIAGWRQSALAVVAEDAYGYKLIPLTDAEQQALAARGAVGWLPWWRFTWGWLVIALFAGFVRGELHWQARRRAIMGIL